MATTKAAQEARTKNRRNKGLSTDELHRRWPILKALTGPPTPEGERAWDVMFTLRPDAMHALLRDMIKLTYATPGRIGQRPMPKESEVDFEDFLWTDLNELPLVEVLPKLLDGISERAFCMKIAMSRSTFQRLMTGQYLPTANELRDIAKAVRKPPTFFIEYRKLMAVEAFINLIEDRPGIATRLYRDYVTVKTA